MTGEPFWDDGNEHCGDPHVLVLYAYEPPAPGDVFSDGEMQFDIEHPPTCALGQEEDPYGEGLTSWTCDVQDDLDNVGVPFTLKYSGTSITEPGRYRVQSWKRRIHIYEYGWEYDGGIGVLDWDEPDHGRQPLTDEDRARAEE